MLAFVIVYYDLWINSMPIYVVIDFIILNVYMLFIKKK